MKKLLKIAIWVIGVIAVVVLILMGIGAYIGYSNKDAIASGEKQGREFAKSTDKEGCLVEASRRLSNCEGMCLEQGVFLGSCLVNTSGDKEVFCSDKPTDDSDYSKGTWRQHCSNNSLSKLQCELFFKSFTAYCRGEFDNK